MKTINQIKVVVQPNKSSKADESVEEVKKSRNENLEEAKKTRSKRKLRFDSDSDFSDASHESNGEQEACKICRQVGRLFYCDFCLSPYHLSCLRPPLQRPPRGPFKCKACVRIFFYFILNGLLIFLFSFIKVRKPQVEVPTLFDQSEESEESESDFQEKSMNESSGTESEEEEEEEEEEEKEEPIEQPKSRRIITRRAAQDIVPQVIIHNTSDEPTKPIKPTRPTRTPKPTTTKGSEPDVNPSFRRSTRKRN